MSKQTNRIAGESWIDGNKRFPSLEKALQYFKKKGVMDNYVDDQGEIRWWVTPYGLWLFLLGDGSNRSFHKSLNVEIKLLKKRQLIYRQRLPNGKRRWWPTAEGFKEGLGAKSGLYLDAIQRVTDRQVI